MIRSYALFTTEEFATAAGEWIHKKENP